VDLDGPGYVILGEAMNTESSRNAAGSRLDWLLGIDTCGPSGSVALGCLTGMHTVRIVAMRELEGRSYSATLVSAVGDLLTSNGIKLPDIGCIAAVNGPGSFTGVRVGLSAVKGLAEPFGTPVVAVSRLEVLAKKAGVLSSALDAHRHEIFLRHAGLDLRVQELLAGRADLERLSPASRVAVCDEEAAALLRSAWPDAVLVQVAAPHAGDALALAAPEISSGEFVDLALLDGHYLRRSDAEVFGPPSTRSS
jgi:tRNA threonylcarbamoyladenosine biosynthesis protein TsaB